MDFSDKSFVSFMTMPRASKLSEYEKWDFEPFALSEIICKYI